MTNGGGPGHHAAGQKKAKKPKRQDKKGAPKTAADLRKATMRGKLKG